jgi:N4-gp56 family major capsid protein
VMRYSELYGNIERLTEKISPPQMRLASNRMPMILQSLAPAMLYVPTPTMNYITVCDKVSIPANGGTTCRFMRPRALQPPTIQLGNSGIDPPAQIPQRDIIDAQMAFFGTGCIINEQVILQDQEGVLAWVSERLAVAMRQAEDLILRDYIVSAASQINAGGGTNGDNPTNLGMTDFSLVATTLDTNNAYKFMSGIEGMDRFGTGPVRSAYFMLSSTELQSDFDGLVNAGFLNQWNYPTNSSALPSEYGAGFNVRVLTSSEAPVARGASANANDLYYNTVLGKQAITHINQDGYSMNLIYRDPYYSGMLAQNATLAVKFAQSQAITQDTAIRNLLCTRVSNLGV